MEPPNNGNMRPGILSFIVGGCILFLELSLGPQNEFLQLYSQAVLVDDIVHTPMMIIVRTSVKTLLCHNVSFPPTAADSGGDAGDEF